MLNVQLVVKIPLSGGHEALVDETDFEWLNKYSHHRKTMNEGKLVYAGTQIDGRSVPMHRLIMGLEIGDKRIVHHVNGNGLDNRRSNLRIVDASTHSMHHPRKGRKKSGKVINVTTITLVAEEAARFKEAISHYGFQGMAGFFRLAGRTLINHYKRGDALLTPLSFQESNSNANANETKKRSH